MGMIEEKAEEVQDEIVEEAEQSEAEQVKDEEANEVKPDDGLEEDDAEITVSLGEESPTPEEDHKEAAPWIKELRKSHREVLRENKALKAKLEESSAVQKEAEPLGKEPELEDFDYDPDTFKSEWKAWNAKRQQIEIQEAEVRAEQAAAQQAWQNKVDAYQTAKSKLKVQDYDDAEHTLQQSMSNVQQNIILQGADNPALLVYALGKNPEKVKELAAIKDPVKYAFAIAKLETQLKVTKRSGAPAPDRPVSNKTGSSISGTVDSALDRIMAEAERTGDYSKVLEHRRQQRK